MKQFYTLLFMLLLLLGIVVVTVQAGEQSLTQNQGSETYKVVVEPGALDPNAPGVTLLADYGSYQLFSVINLQLNGLGSEQDYSFVVDDMDVMEINGHVLDTQNDDLLMSRLQSSSITTGHSLQLVQFVGPIKDEWLAEVEAVGGEPIHYIANNGYLVWADENGRSQLNALYSQESYLQFNAPMPSYLKLSPDLVGEMDAGEETAVVPIIIQMVQHEGQAKTEAFIEDLLLTQVSDWQPVLKFQTIYGTIHQSDIETIAQQPDVYWLGVQQTNEPMDEVQGQILAGNIVMTSTYSAKPTGPGYLDWLDSYGFSKNPADYPIVDITDDGIGNGRANNAAGDQSLRELGLSSSSSRIAYVGTCANEGDGSGIGGHGHINMSIAGGYDTSSGFPFRDSDGYQLGLGINPYGRFGGTRVFYFEYSIFPYGATFWDISSCGDTYAGLIKENQDSGAKIVNNSWGCNSFGCLSQYTEATQAYDVGVRDADSDEPGNQEIIYVFSAGNENGRSASILSPASAKNVITVGASENYRPYDIDGCGMGVSEADDVMDIAAFSSWGPAVGDRAKPELVAPGSHVQGTASTNTFFNGNTICGAEDNDLFFPADDAFYPENQSWLTWSSGTSHSAPAVAGIASLYYYWLENTYQMDSPSPALMKAYLMAHTRYLNGARANDTLPSNRQGYGLPDMSLGLDDTPRVFIDQQIILGDSGEYWTKEVRAADPTKPVRIILAYTDAAGALGTNPQVNDLNLRVDSLTDTYYGNYFQGQWSEPAGAPDSKNNYEAIYLPPSEAEKLNITVTGFNIAGDGVPNNADETDQDFALVCYNCQELLQVAPTSQSVCLSENSVTYEVTAVSQPRLDEEITYSADNLPAGTTGVFSPNPATLPGSSILTISNLAAASTGKYLIDIQGATSLITGTNQVELNLVAQNPGDVTLTLPADGSEVESGSILLTWEEATEGKTYSVEIATDSAFTNIVESVTGLTEALYQADNLLMNTTYYWRVKSSNDCGAGEFSQPFTFFVLICEECNELSVIPDDQAVCTLSDDDVVYEVTAVSLPGLEEEISYSANNLPSGTTAVFSPNPATLPVSSTLTLSDLDKSLAGEYLIEIEGVSSAMTRTAQVGLSLFTQNPGLPILTSPPNGTRVNSISVLLTWQEATQGQTYSVEIADDDAFTDIIESVSGLSETQYQTGLLAPNNNYYWRVNGSNECGDGNISLPFNFSTQTTNFLPMIIKE